ncbi:MAG TPA: hypothetical protein VGA56_01900, partial [Opitutaceae bacterium]
VERVTILLEPTAGRLNAQLNPETVEIRRRAGVVRRALPGGAVNALADNEDALLHTGGGRTEIELDLLFDLDLAGWSGETDDVRELTEPFFRLTEATDSVDGRRRVPAVRILWGKRCNMRVVVEAISERLDRFDADGTPRQSRMRLRLLRLPEPQAASADVFAFPESEAAVAPGGGGVFESPLSEDALLPAGEPGLGPVESDWRDALPGGTRLDEFLEEIERKADDIAAQTRFA